jgi:hypothetical protein
MNRPYYALAALLAVLTGSAVAVGSARSQSATAFALPSRALCASSPRDLVVAANLFVQFDTSWEASRRAVFAGSKQGSDETMSPDYVDSCGYDPYRGERYDSECSRDADSGADSDEGTYAEEVETWPSDERIESGFRQFQGCEGQAVCGGDEIHCPYLGGRMVDRDADDSAVESVGDEVDVTEDDCHRAYKQWLAEQQAQEAVAAEAVNDESAFFADPAGDAWKTAPVATPDWISDYLSACQPSLEEQYAQAELQAAQDASSEYGATLSDSPAPESAADKSEYESLYNLDAYLIPEREESEATEEVETDNGPVVWSLSRIFGEVVEMVEEILPLVEEEADDLHDAVDEAWQRWNDMASQLALPRGDAAMFGPRYSEEYEDPIISRDEQIVDVEPTLPVETVQSRELLTSLADSLRAAGQLLLTVADELEAEADRVLSAEVDDYWSR